ncbi:MAG: alkaline phosphatase family protein [Deltaproteobacteria bacterium]|nr:alkaline phosphatase family protein [Deltaproteobacteria bacterium]
MRLLPAAAMAVALTVVDVGPRGRVVAEAQPSTAQDAAPRGPADPVVLVVVDGVRWQEIFDGPGSRVAATRMPNLHRLATERGAAIGGADGPAISASGPNFVSLPSYREIFSGRSGDDCTDNECPRIARPTIVDELHARGRPVAVFASWEKIDLAAASRPEGLRISAGRGGAPGDPWPGAGDFRRDRETSALALRHLEEARPDFLFLGLGETDEYAHHGDYAGYVDALTTADEILGELMAALTRMGERGARTHVFVTTDHGRANGFRDHGGRFPESGRVWLVAAGPRISARGAVPLSRALHLRDIAPTVREIVALPRVGAGREAGAPIDALLR